MTDKQTRAALVIAHPGHELMVHGWLEVAQPRVFVFTDGSGHSNQARLVSTTKILDQAAAERGSLYGRLTDAAAYAAILNHDFELFIGFARELAEVFVNERIDSVAGDALEGYNPMHDVCRLVINAAVNVAQRKHAHQVANYEFSLVSQPEVCPEPPPANEIWLRLDEPAFARKIAAARGYRELAGEVLSAFGRNSIAAFGVERLSPVAPDPSAHRSNGRPFYEQYGEKQVAAGHYTHVLRYDEHMAPLAEALGSYAEERQ